MDILIPLVPVMARLAKRLELAKQELGPIAAMRLDMVGNRCRADNATLEAYRAQRLGPQLRTPTLAPAFQPIPSVGIILPRG